MISIQSCTYNYTIRFTVLNKYSLYKTTLFFSTQQLLYKVVQGLLSLEQYLLLFFLKCINKTPKHLNTLTHINQIKLKNDSQPLPLKLSSKIYDSFKPYTHNHESLNAALFLKSLSNTPSN